LLALADPRDKPEDDACVGVAGILRCRFASSTPEEVTGAASWSSSSGLSRGSTGVSPATTFPAIAPMQTVKYPKLRRRSGSTPSGWA